jgi:hypothetical protein
MQGRKEEGFLALMLLLLPELLPLHCGAWLLSCVSRLHSAVNIVRPADGGPLATHDSCCATRTVLHSTVQYSTDGAVRYSACPPLPVCLYYLSVVCLA